MPTEAEIDGLTEGESNSLELKGSRFFDKSIDEACKGLAKAVSAFANTGGGRLILGVHDDNKSGERFIDGGIPMDLKRPNTVEWLNNQISALVDPPLQNFSIQAIERTGETSKIEPDRAVIIIDIGDSEQAPHQSTKDLLFYGRLGGKSQPLSHRFIMDIANRRKHPSLELYFAINPHSRPMTFVYDVRNTGKVMARCVAGRIAFPSQIPLIPDSSTAPIIWAGEQRRAAYFQFENIHPGRTRSGRVQLINQDYTAAAFQGLEIFWDASADDAPMTKGITDFTKVKILKMTSS